MLAMVATAEVCVMHPSLSLPSFLQQKLVAKFKYVLGTSSQMQGFTDGKNFMSPLMKWICPHPKGFSIQNLSQKTFSGTSTYYLNYVD